MGTEVRFYHLTTRSLDSALPEILAKAYAGGRRVVVKTVSAAQADHLNDHLWTYSEGSFLPHGAKKDGFAADQPLWLTDRDENPNGADVLILAGGATCPDPAAFSLCCEMLDGDDTQQIAAARERYKQFRNAGFTVTYWRQTETGGWEKAA